MHHCACGVAAVLLLLPLLLPAPAVSSGIPVFPYYPDPTTNPQYRRHAVTPPSAHAFPPNVTLFVANRGGCSASAFALYAASPMSDPLWWPQYPVLYTQPAGALATCLAAVRAANVTALDISNYVPGDTDKCDGSAPASSGVCEYHLPLAVNAALTSTLGSDGFLGMDNGEQDGRYVGRFAGLGVAAAAAGPEAQYLRFARHFDRMADDLGGRLMGLSSLYYPHYYAKSGWYTMLAAETAQALPNAQLFYAFLRGAARQYAQRIWGNASIYNRWGHKTCSSPTACSASGTSLALLKRLAYTQVAYNTAIFGYEGSMTVDANLTLSPIGALQANTRTWHRAQGPIGAFVPTVAVLLDFFAGYTPPRHLYTENVYRTWGGRSFGRSEHWAHAVFDLLYPGYADASYYHDERGFLAPTPYGDVADVLLTDATAADLGKYAVVLVAGALGAVRAETRDRLTAFAQAGGVVVLAADALQGLAAANGSAGLSLGGLALAAPAGTTAGTPRRLAANSTVTLQAGTTIIEPYAMDVYSLALPLPQGTTTQASVSDGVGGTLPLAVAVPLGRGRIVALTTPGVAAVPAVPLPLVIPGGGEDFPLPVPFPRLAHVEALVGNVVLANATLFTADDTTKARRAGNRQTPLPFGNVSTAAPLGLSLAVTRRSPGEYTLVVSNNALVQQPLVLTSHIGAILSLREAPLNTSETTCSGYLPDGTANATLGLNTNTTIAGLSVRIFYATVDDSQGVVPLPSPTPLPAPPSGRGLPVAPTHSTAPAGAGGDGLREAILLRPTFFQHFDTAVVDWRALESRDIDSLVALGRWAGRQRLRLVADFRSGINLYPDLRLVQNAADEYASSLARIAGVLDKMVVMNAAAANATSGNWSMPAAHVVLGGHTTVENYYSPGQEAADLRAALANVTRAAALRGNMSVLLAASGSGAASSEALALSAVQDVRAAGGANNLFVAPAVASLLAEGITTPAILTQRLPGLVALAPLWFASVPQSDPLVAVDLGYAGRAAVSDSGTQANACGLLRVAATAGAAVLLDADMTTPPVSGAAGDGPVRAVEDAEYAEVAWLEACLAQ